MRCAPSGERYAVSRISPDTALSQHLRQPLGSIVVRRQQIILRIEPENDIDFRFSRRSAGRTRSQPNQGEN